MKKRKVRATDNRQYAFSHLRPYKSTSSEELMEAKSVNYEPEEGDINEKQSSAEEKPDEEEAGGVLFVIGASLAALAAFAGIGLAVKAVAKKKVKAPEKYSDSWMQGLSKEMLATERENVRKNLCKKEFATKYDELRRILDRFDDENRRRFSIEHPELKNARAYSSPREHGWNLYKPDKD